MSLPNPHDSFFREMFSQPVRLAGLLRAILPPDAVSKLDFDALRLEPQRYVDEALSDFETDLVARVPLLDANSEDDAPYLCILVEHQSSPDRFMPLRILVYSTRIWEQHRRHHPEASTLPPVVPVVVYQGERRWSGPRTLHGLMPALHAFPDLAPFVPSLEMCLDELNQVSDEALDSRPLDVSGRVALVALKHVRGDALNDLIHGWVRRVSSADALRPPELRDLTRLLQYLVIAAPRLKEEIMESIKQELAEPAVEVLGKPLAERWMERGEARGEARGIAAGERNVLRRLLTRRFGALPVETEARLEAASTDDLERWAETLLDAPTLADVFA